MLPCSLHKAVVELQRFVTKTKIDMNDTQMEKCLSVKEREKRGITPAAEQGLKDALYL